MAGRPRKLETQRRDRRVVVYLDPVVEERLVSLATQRKRRLGDAARIIIEAAFEEADRFEAESDASERAQDQRVTKPLLYRTELSWRPTPSVHRPAPRDKAGRKTASHRTAA